MALLHAPTHRPGAEARLRLTVNVVLLLAVVLDFVGQALDLVPSGAVPLLVLVAVLAVPTALVVGRSTRSR